MCIRDRVKEVATIQSAIRDRGEITGSFSPVEVESLSKLLRTGALPASLHQLEKRFVGASLGADSIREGVTAAIVGVLLVMAFMLVYYKGSVSYTHLTGRKPAGKRGMIHCPAKPNSCPAKPNPLKAL